MAAMGFPAVREVGHQLHYPVIEAQVLRGPAAGNDQGVVILGADVVEGGVQDKIMPPLFAVGLVALKIVHRSAHEVPGLFPGADRVHRMPHHGEHLEGHHGLVVFDVIPDDHQDFFAAMGPPQIWGLSPALAPAWT